MAQKTRKEMTHSPKGMHDMLPVDVEYYNKISHKAREVAEYYGFAEIKTPHLEHTELFVRPLGETSDAVQKEMYSLRTKGGDSLTLRPEWTAASMRAYAEHGMSSWPQPVKLFCEGSFFRHENPQRGRLREFHQFDIEVIGEADPVIDALSIKVMYLILAELGFKNIIVHVNSIGDKNCRHTHRKELVNYYRRKVNYICKNCKLRLKENPLRILDCKEPGCVELRAQAPQMITYLCDACKVHFRGVLEFLDEAWIPYSLDHFLVRGFDYYSRTVFEVFLEEEPAKSSTKIEGVPEDTPEAKERPSAIALAGGGRFDDLMALLGQRAIPAAGAAMGIERIIHEMKRTEIPLSRKPQAKVFLIQIGPAAKKKSFVLLDELRDAGIRVDSSLSRDNLKAQLNIAAKTGARLTILIGQKEAMEGSVIIRDMNEGAQETIMLPKLVEKLKAKLKAKQ